MCQIFYLQFLKIPKSLTTPSPNPYWPLSNLFEILQIFLKNTCLIKVENNLLDKYQDFLFKYSFFNELKCEFVN